MAATLKKLSLDEKNELIRCPRNLVTNDGRQIYIQEWKPCISFDGMTTVEIKAFIIREPVES